MLAVSLARQSQRNEDQADSVSLAFQHRRCAEEAERRGDEIVATFDDLDVPGSIEHRSKRLGLHAMMAHLKQSPSIRRAYVYNISRLARDTLYALELVRDLANMKPPVELCSTSENIEDPTILAIIAAMASRERTTLSNNVAFAIREQARRGLVTQQPPIGYSRVAGVLVPNDDAGTVRRIFRAYTSGETTTQIADRLRRDNIRSPYGLEGWRGKAIRALLSRRTYIGEIEISETRDPAGRVRPHVVTKGQHEPLIDPATWELAQRLLADRATVRRKDGRVEPWLSGAIVCTHCGKRVYVGVRSRQTSDGAPRWYCKCSTHQMASDARTTSLCPGQASCDLSTIEPVARAELWAKLRTVIPADDAHRRAVATTSTVSARTRRQLETRIAKHQDRAAVLLETRMDRSISADEFVRARGVEEAEIARLEAELVALPQPRPLADYRAAHAVIVDWERRIPAATDDELRHLVALTGARATLDLRAKAARWSFAPPYDGLLG